MLPTNSQDVVDSGLASIYRHYPFIQGDSVWFSREACEEAGSQLASQYRNAKPFPYIALTNFLPAEMLRRVLEEFPPLERGRFTDSHSNLKTGYQLEKIKSVYINSLINALNSSAFLNFLEQMSGIKGLIPDPHQVGGGLHETRRGGHLSIHADFNMHPTLKLKRRLNLILFLNENWLEEYGGSLELWATDMSRCCAKIAPHIGTAVVFNTDTDSFHGHPDPLTCPADVTRRSLALYYYTADLPSDVHQFSRTTDFRQRPSSSDRIDFKTKSKNFLKEICPPFIYKALK